MILNLKVFRYHSITRCSITVYFTHQIYAFFKRSFREKVVKTRYMNIGFHNKSETILNNINIASTDLKSSHKRHCVRRRLRVKVSCGKNELSSLTIRLRRRIAFDFLTELLFRLCFDLIFFSRAITYCLSTIVKLAFIGLMEIIANKIQRTKQHFMYLSCVKL